MWLWIPLVSVALLVIFGIVRAIRIEMKQERCRRRRLSEALIEYEGSLFILDRSSMALYTFAEDSSKRVEILDPDRRMRIMYNGSVISGHASAATQPTNGTKL